MSRVQGAKVCKITGSIWCSNVQEQKFCEVMLRCRLHALSGLLPNLTMMKMMMMMMNHVTIVLSDLFYLHVSQIDLDSE